MKTTDLTALWENAAAFDPTLRIDREQIGQLRHKRVAPGPYARTTLFSAMAEGRPAILSGVPVPVALPAGCDMETALGKVIGSGIARGERVRVQVGPARNRRTLPVRDLMRRWRSGRGLVSVTDLHIRGTRLETRIDTTELSAFNLLPLGSEEMQRQEMMTLVVSSRGNVTDSHSDDPDGSNHCFVGRKLWLAWDTFEGQRAGLQDCEREAVYDRARFRMGSFLRLRSARWWTVEAGQTLFLPGGLTHKVITLDRYAGIGSFYVAPASCLDSLSRWYVHGPLWSQDDPRGECDGLIDEIADAMCDHLSTVRSRPAATRQQWGLDYARPAITHWKRRWPQRRRDSLMRRPRFARLVRSLADTQA